MSDIGSDDSYEVINYSEHPLYVILRALLQDDNGNTICDHLGQLTEAVNRNTAAIEKKLSAKQHSERMNHNEALETNDVLETNES